MKRWMRTAASLALLFLLGAAGAAAQAADSADGEALRIRNKDWKGVSLVLRDGRVYGAPETLARGGRWDITKDGGAYYAAVPVAGGEKETVRLPVGQDGLADLSFFGERAGLTYKLNEKKKEIKFDKPKKEGKKKAKKEKNKQAEPVLLLWDPDTDFDPARPFFSGEGVRRIVAPGWGTYDAVREGKRYYPVDYIRRAQDAGVAVMPMVNNNFDPKATTAFLADEEKRREFLRRLEAYTAVYGLDGWNLDFENMNPADAAAYVDFVRDAAEVLHGMDRQLSVDISPMGSADSYWSGCYDRKGLAAHVDYEILMGYDQTGGSSPWAGPVSAYDWLERILPPILEEVPAEKLVLGLPFYTRVWTGDDGRVDSDVLTLYYTEGFARRHKIVPRWQEKEKQFYADWRENGVRRRVWLEEGRSLSAKLGLVEKYGLAGAAFWRYGYETPEIYGALDRAL